MGFPPPLAPAVPVEVPDADVAICLCCPPVVPPPYDQRRCRQFPLPCDNNDMGHHRHHYHCAAVAAVAVVDGRHHHVHAHSGRDGT